MGCLTGTISFREFNTETLLNLDFTCPLVWNFVVEMNQNINSLHIRALRLVGHVVMIELLQNC